MLSNSLAPANICDRYETGTLYSLSHASSLLTPLVLTDIAVYISINNFDYKFKNQRRSSLSPVMQDRRPLTEKLPEVPDTIRKQCERVLQRLEKKVGLDPKHEPNLLKAPRLLMDLAGVFTRVLV